MTHQEVQQGDIIERYVRHQLSPDERRAFQEHYFDCAECFAQVQMTARFVAGVRQAARQNLLAAVAAEPWWANWFKPALVLATALAVFLALGIAWLLLKQPAVSPEEIAGKPSPTVMPQAESTPVVAESPQVTQPNLAKTQTPPPADIAALGKSPVVFLDSERGAKDAGTVLRLPANAASAILRLDVEPNSPFSSFRFQLFDSAKRLVTTVTSGKANANGAVSASIPAKLLQPGKYVVKCYGLRDGQPEPVGEYRLQVQIP